MRNGLAIPEGYAQRFRETRPDPSFPKQDLTPPSLKKIVFFSVDVSPA